MQEILSRIEHCEDQLGEMECFELRLIDCELRSSLSDFVVETCLLCPAGSRPMGRCAKNHRLECARCLAV